MLENMHRNKGDLPKAQYQNCLRKQAVPLSMWLSVLALLLLILLAKISL